MNIIKHCCNVKKFFQTWTSELSVFGSGVLVCGFISRWLVSSCHASQFGLPIGNRSRHEHIFGNMCFWFKYSESSWWTTVILIGQGMSHVPLRWQSETEVDSQFGKCLTFREYCRHVFTSIYAPFNHTAWDGIFQDRDRVTTGFTGNGRENTCTPCA